MDGMDIDAKLDKSLAELIKTSKPQKQGNPRKKSVSTQPASAQPSASRSAPAQGGRSGRRKRGKGGSGITLGAKSVIVKVRPPKKPASTPGERRAAQPAAPTNGATGRRQRRGRGRGKQPAQQPGGQLPPQQQQQRTQQSQQRQRASGVSGSAAPVKGIVVTLQNEYYRPVVRNLVEPGVVAYVHLLSERMLGRLDG